MARHEENREDILREATALVERIEFELPDAAEPLIVGFRRDGSASFFFGSDFVVQFNSRNELRRAFWNTRLIKADRGQLCFMDRERSAQEVILRTTAFSKSESHEFLGLVEQQLQSLAAAMRSGKAKTLRQIPSEIPLDQRVLTWLETHAGSISIAQKPNVH
jgi:hypothetical protein